MTSSEITHLADPKETHLISRDEALLFLNSLDYYEEWVAEVAEEPDNGFGSQAHYRRELTDLRSLKDRLLKEVVDPDV